MAKIKVGVLRGGPSSEYEVSLKTGEAILRTLQQAQGKYEPIDILIDKSGAWHLFGLQTKPEKVFRTIDAAFNALHGEYGEDGKVQRLLETYKMPYTGSDALSSAIAIHKRLAREVFAISNILTPPAVSIRAGDNISAKAAEAGRKTTFPMIVKPVSRGSSLGVSIAKNIYELIEMIQSTFKYDDEILVEKMIQGREATCAILENFRGESHYALPVIEIIPPPRKSIFDYECKYNGSTQEICPGRFGPEIAEQIKKAAIAAHQSLGCRHYSRSDFMIDKNGRVYMLELNTLPGLTSESLYPKAASAAGLEFPDLLEHLINLAIN